MNSKERVKKAFHFAKPDRVPMSCFTLKTDFFPAPQYIPKSWQPKDYPPHVQGGVESISRSLYRIFSYNWRNRNRKLAKYPKKWWKYPHYSIDEWGIIWKNSGTLSDDITKGHPFKGPFQENWDELDNYQIPNPTNPERFRLFRSGFWKILGRNKYIVGEINGNGFFNMCSQLRGFNNFLIDIAKNRKKVDQLIQIIIPFYLKQIKMLKENYPDLDSITIADDLGSQKSPFISPILFKRYFKDAYRRIVQLTHNLGMDFILHSCGQILELMPEIIDTGVDVFEFDSPLMTGVDNFKKFAETRKVAFWLSSNIQSTYLLGSPEEVKEQVKLYIRNIGNNEGGLAIYEYPSNRTLGTPKENIIAQREATLKWGVYNETGIINWL